jgi:TolB-like protein
MHDPLHGTNKSPRTHRYGGAVTDPRKAVFLSYASQDAEAAQNLCNALRFAGIEVWFDQSELRGGDAWDASIRRQIKSCALFVPIISAHTQARPEGYFRLEWNLAVERSHLMAAEKAFLVPVVVDATTEPEALVPTQFREVHWTRILAGEVSAAFVDRIAALLNQPVAARVGSLDRGVNRAAARRLPTVLTALSVAAVVALVIATAMRGGWLSQRNVPKVEMSAVSAPVANATAAIPEKSVAVLPFVDISEKKDQEYFSDGLSEELIDMLTKVTDLRVPARTSSFYFKGKQTTIADIAKVLRVAHVLEGSVRKSGKHLRITAQLVRVDDGYHVWSETYDRQVGDVFEVQDEIAAAVVEALKVSLMGRPMVTVKGTQNIEAYNLYLQGRSLYLHADTLAEVRKVAGYTRKALAADAKYAPAWAFLARVLSFQADLENSDESGPVIEEGQRAVQRALELDPQLAEAHAAAARIFMYGLLDLPHAQIELSKALAIDPNNSYALSLIGAIYEYRGQFEKALHVNERAINGDPANPMRYGDRGYILYLETRYSDALSYYQKARDLNPGRLSIHSDIGSVLLAEGNPAAGLAEMDLEKNEEARLCNQSRGLAFAALGRKAEADAVLTYMVKNCARINPSGIGRLYADRGEVDQAFNWFDRAYHQHDGDLLSIKVDPLLRNVQSDPRFGALLNKLGLAE